MERHGRAGEASEPESHPIKESRDTSNSTSSKNILGNEITAIGLSQVEEVPNSGVLRVGRGDTCTVYQVGRQVGLGTFSAVYEGLRLLDHKQVAIKFLQEVGNSSFSQLQAESRTYKSLKGWNRAPDVVFFGDHGRSRLLITILEELHDRDFIHRDIKAENFYRSGNPPRHIMYREGSQFIGTARYASINTHMGCEQSRRDDLEALWYMLLYFIRGKLPWQCATPTPRAEKHERIREAKQTTTIEDLCEGRSELLAAQSLNLPPPTQTPKAAVPSTSFHRGHSTNKRDTLKAIVRVTGTWLDQPLFTAKSKQPSEGVIMYNAKAQVVLEDIGKFSKDCVWRLQQSHRNAVRIRALLSDDVADIVDIPATDRVEKAVGSLLGLSYQVSGDILVKGHSEKTSVLREALKEVKILAQCELEDLSSPEIREGDRPITPEDHHWL
ncbi:casein kinase I [Verticillium dahliae]|nr:casein kinase I [Verticillium dahliae]